MKQFKGTQGEWESAAIDLADYKQVSIGSGKKVICHLHIENEISEEVKSNAQLIAAAPELLEALQHIVDYEERMRANNDPKIGNGHFNKAKQVINKALGG
ncbi:hypothetical protein D0T49_04360 [Paludibacter sp. 221]|uniref:hypothetical protein n=1 Tax=Paludibacter sp. 221 TaxID=2302939 RepID=UPI0013D79485|nr:hypothetical protein [Paludibacter sp. 221]NDV46272.1 hypothetical protein [Paludibacter sp. 221]